tara:strand:- start:296 stop:559 length:264 start_codon:yes stop_codon:yes gene_type:complete
MTPQALIKPTWALPAWSGITPSLRVSNPEAVQAWVLKQWRRKINIIDPSYKFTGPGGNAAERDAVLAYARALMRLLVQAKGWDASAL